MEPRLFLGPSSVGLASLCILLLQSLPSALALPPAGATIYYNKTAFLAALNPSGIWNSSFSGLPDEPIPGPYVFQGPAPNNTYQVTLTSSIDFFPCSESVFSTDEGNANVTGVFGNTKPKAFGGYFYATDRFCNVELKPIQVNFTGSTGWTAVGTKTPANSSDAFMGVITDDGSTISSFEILVGVDTFATWESFVFANRTVTPPTPAPPTPAPTPKTPCGNPEYLLITRFLAPFTQQNDIITYHVTLRSKNPLQDYEFPNGVSFVAELPENVTYLSSKTWPKSAVDVQEKELGRLSGDGRSVIWWNILEDQPPVRSFEVNVRVNANAPPEETLPFFGRTYRTVSDIEDGSHYTCQFEYAPVATTQVKPAARRRLLNKRKKTMK